MCARIEEIGPALAETLSEASPTVAELVAASQEELTPLEGVGEKRGAPRAVGHAYRDHTSRIGTQPSSASTRSASTAFRTAPRSTLSPPR